MKGDRVKITTGTLYEDSPDALIFVYAVKLDKGGSPIRAQDGSVQVESMGGVKNNCTAVIVGANEKVHRSQLKDHDSPAGLGSNDFVHLVPVMLDTYQKLGWFPTNNIRVLEGGVAR